MPRYVSRAKRLEKALLALSDNDVERCKEDVETLLGEMESWRDKLDGTNFEATEKFEDIEECISQLEEGIEYLEQIMSASWYLQIEWFGRIEKSGIEFTGTEVEQCDFDIYEELKGFAEGALSNVEFPGMY